MNLKEHDSGEGMRVWLSQNEVELLLEAADATEQRIAYALGARGGLRSHEILEVSPTDVFSTDAGDVLRVEHGKGDKYRETPLPRDLATTLRTVDDVRDEPSSDPFLPIETTRSLRNWLEATRDELAEETGDDRWTYVSFHDLRRTWASSLADLDVDPLLVCEWGGWEDLETFLEHYRGNYSPEAQRRERAKVDWL